MNKKINFYRNFLKVFLDLHYDTDDGFEVRLFLHNSSFSLLIFQFIHSSAIAGFSIPALFPLFRSTSSTKGFNSSPKFSYIYFLDSDSLLKFCIDFRSRTRYSSGQWLWSRSHFWQTTTSLGQRLRTGTKRCRFVEIQWGIGQTLAGFSVSPKNLCSV